MESAARVDAGRMQLTPPQIERYSRQILVPEIGARGQKRLLASRVAMAPANLTTRTTARHLVASGVGRVAMLATAAAAEDNVAIEATEDRPWESVVASRSVIDRTDYDAVVIATAANAPGFSGLGLSDAGSPVLWAWAHGSRLNVTTFGSGEIATPPSLGPAATIAPDHLRETIAGLWLAVMTLRFLLDLGIDSGVSTFDLDAALHGYAGSQV